MIDCRLLFIVNTRKYLPAHFSQLSVTQYSKASSWKVSYCNLGFHLFLLYWCRLCVVVVFTHLTPNTAAVGVTHYAAIQLLHRQLWWKYIFFSWRMAGRRLHVDRVPHRSAAVPTGWNKASNKLQTREATGWNRVSGQGLLLCGSSWDICITGF